MKKAVSVLLAILILVGCVTIPVFAQNFKTSKIYDFEANQPFNVANVSPGAISLSSETAYPLSGTASLKASVGALSNGWDFIYAGGISDGTGKSGFVLRLKTNTTTSSLLGITAFNPSTYGEAYFTVGSKLLDKNMVDITPTTYYDAPWAALWIPANFDGYVYFPFSASTNVGFNPEQIAEMKIRFIGSAWTDKNAYIDDISYYRGNIPLKPISYIHNFENSQPFGIANISGAVSTALETTTPLSGEKSLKVTIGTFGSWDFLYAGGIPNGTGKSGFVYRLKTNLSVATEMFFWADGTYGRTSFLNGTRFLDNNMVDITPTNYYNAAGDGTLWIPAGFDGYVYMPFSSSTNSGFSPAQIIEIKIGFVGSGWSNTVSYIDDVSYYSGNIPINPISYIYNFETAQPFNVANLAPGSIVLSSDTTSSLSGATSLKATFGNVAADLEHWDFIYAGGVANGTGKSGFVYRLKTNTAAPALMNLLVDGSYGRAKFTVGSKLLDKNMVDITPANYYNEPWGALWIPAGFDGYVYMPFSSSTNANFDPAQIAEMKIGFIGPAWNNTVASIDNISYYSGNIPYVSPVNLSSFHLNSNVITNVGTGIKTGNFDAMLDSPTGVDIIYTNNTNNTVGTGTTINVQHSVDNTNLATYKVVIYGDTSGDGSIDVSDLALIKKHLLKSAILSNEYFTAGDIFSTGKISISDLIAIKKHILNIALISQA